MSKKPETTTITHEEMVEAWTRPLAPVSIQQCHTCWSEGRMRPTKLTEQGDACSACDGNGMKIERLPDWRRNDHPGSESMRVTINGKQRDIANTTIDYLSATALAYPGHADVLYTVTWKRPDGASGSLIYGQRIVVVDGMAVNVAYTGCG